jgi:hypothetical protein
MPQASLIAPFHIVSNCDTSQGVTQSSKSSIVSSFVADQVPPGQYVIAETLNELKKQGNKIFKWTAT